MHIPKDKPLKKPLFFGGAVVLILILVGVFWQNIRQVNQQSFTTTQSIKTERPKKGSFEHSISGFGVLKSNTERVIMSKVAGTISQLHIKPGAVVAPDQVIIELSNSTIERNLVDARFELEAAEAQFSLKQAAIAEQEFKLRNEVQMAQADLSILQAELAAHENLAERKIISKFDYEKVKLQLKKNQLRHQLSQQQLDNFIINKPLKLRANEFELAKAKRQLEVAQTEHGALQVTAGMSGVLKSLDESVLLGTWLNKDTKVGEVTNTDDLYAEIEVNAAEANSIDVGMKVLLNVKGQRVEGTITRIAPNVVNNRVQLDAALTSTLPKAARPDIEVNANIIAQDIPNTLTLTRPGWLNIDTGQVQLYVQPANSQGYHKRTVTIGAASQTTLQIVDGLNLNEQVIISNTSGWVQEVVNIQG